MPVAIPGGPSAVLYPQEGPSADYHEDPEPAEGNLSVTETAPLTSGPREVGTCQGVPQTSGVGMENTQPFLSNKTVIPAHFLFKNIIPFYPFIYQICIFTVE